VHLASLHDRAIAEDVRERLPHAFSTVDDEEHAALHAQPSLDEVVDQRDATRSIVLASQIRDGGPVGKFDVAASPAWSWGVLFVPIVENADVANVSGIRAL